MSALFKAACINNRLIVAQTLGKVLLICSLHFYVIHAAVAVGNPHIKAYALCIACLVECFLISYIANRPIESASTIFKTVVQIDLSCITAQNI